MTSPPALIPDYIKLFSNKCVFVRSLYLHQKLLFESMDKKQQQRMERTAPIFFQDLNQIFIEHVILEVCKMTDKARDIKKNDNLTIAFLVQHYELSTHNKLAALANGLQIFRKKVIDARNKIISHSDLTTICKGVPLGSVPDSDWNQFWLDLEDTVSIIHQHAHGTQFSINDVANLSDVDGLHKALKDAECLSQIINEGDSAFVNRYSNLVLGD